MCYETCYDRDGLVKRAKSILKYRRDNELDPFTFYPAVKYYRSIVSAVCKMDDKRLSMFVDAFDNQRYDVILSIVDSIQCFANDTWNNKHPARSLPGCACAGKRQ